MRMNIMNVCLVADLYQDWCGPCRSIQSHLRKIKVESSDSDLINYAVVCVRLFER